MKQGKIYMKTWLDLHGRVVAQDTDHWYLEFANLLLPLVSMSYMFKWESKEAQIQATLKFTLYMEDCVADGGNWRQFIHWHANSYGEYLPFYDLTEDYMADEINREDIALLLWTIKSPTGTDFIDVENPFDKDLIEFTDALYDELNSFFEKAPISEALAKDWFMDTEAMDKKSIPLPVILPGEKLPVNVELFLRASGGESLMYFESYESLRLFFIQSLQWEEEEGALMPDLAEFENFVLYANPKGLLIGIDIAHYFSDNRNPMYDANDAEDNGYQLFCEEGLCPFDLLKYGMENNLFLDVQFPFEDGKELLHENWDFIARWFLGEYYEGD